MTGVSSLGQVLDQIDRLKTQQSLFDRLSVQLTTGKKTQEFSGLGTQALTSERARADFKSFDTYITNIVNSDRRIKLMLAAIEEIKEQTENFSNLLVTFSQQGVHQEGNVVHFDDPVTANVVENTQVGYSTANPDIDFRTLQDFAANIFDFMTDLLNTQEGDRYLLGGAESLTKPLNITGTLDAALSTLLGDWKNGTITTASFINDINDRTTAAGNPEALTDSLIGYNPQLSSGTTGNVYVRISDSSEIDYTVLANEEPFRDIIVALSYFKNENLGPIADEVQIDPLTGLPVIITEGAPGADLDEMKENFYAVFNNMVEQVNQAIDDIDQLRFKLEGVRARIDQVKRGHENQRNVLLSTVSQVEDVDINEVALKISSLQVQLEASYRVTAIIQQLSLVNYISPF